MKKAIAYIRVSTVGQEDKFGKDAQLSMINEYCNKNDYEIVEVIEDTISGIKDDRIGFNKILYNYDYANPPFDAVIVAKSDRIARDIKLYYYYFYMLQKKSIELISASEDFRDDPLGDVYRSLLLFVAEQERINIITRTQTGRKIKRDKGGYAGGKVPYGYRSNGTGKLEKDDIESRVVITMFNMFDSKYSFQKIADYLNTGGILTRKGTLWNKGQICQIVQRRKFYEGYMLNNPKQIGMQPAIIGENRN